MSETAVPDDLSHGDRDALSRVYGIGDWTFVPDSNLLTRGQEQRRLERRCAEVLEYLCVHRGRTVTKDELLDRVWEQSAVTDHAIAVVVSTLRRVMDDDSRHPRYILTVPRKGYRLVALEDTSQSEPTSADERPASTTPSTITPANEPAASVEDAPSGDPTAETKSRRRFPLGLGLAGGAIALVIAAFAGGWIMLGGPQPELERAVRQLTFGEDQEAHPALSPDGTQLAFAWNGGEGYRRRIYVQPTSRGTPLPLTRSAHVEVRPDWSPDGKSIVFTRRHIPFDENAGCEIVIVPAVGGPESFAADCGVGIGVRNAQFTPDGRHLIYSANSEDMRTAQLRVTNLDSGKIWHLTQPKTGTIGDQFVALSEDGKRIAFTRGSRPAESDIFILELTDDYRAAGPERRLTTQSVGILDIDWAPDEQGVYFISGFSGEMSVWHLPLSGGEMSELPLNDLTPFSIEFTRDDSIRVVLNQTAAVNMAITQISPEGVDMDSGQDRELKWSEYLDTTIRHDWNPVFSPDGTQVAFLSNRTGPTEIWLLELENREVRQLTDFKTDALGGLHWAPEGPYAGQIAFTRRRNGNLDIALVNTKDGAISTVTNSPASDTTPAWNADGTSLYFTSDRSGAWSVWSADLATGEARQVAPFAANHVDYMADGNWLYFTRAWDKRIWRWNLTEQGESETVVEDAEILLGQNWRIHNNALYYVTVTMEGSKQVILNKVDSTTGERQKILKLPGRFTNGSIDISPDGQKALFSAVTHYTGDLFALENKSN